MEKEKKVAEPEEVKEEQEYDSGDVDEEDVVEEESKETSQELEGVDERAGKQNQSASMSDRSESRSYSSMIRKCEVRKYVYRRNELKTYTIISNIQMLVL